MLLKIVDDKGFRDLEIKEGEMFLLPRKSQDVSFKCEYSSNYYFHLVYKGIFHTIQCDSPIQSE